MKNPKFLYLPIVMLFILLQVAAQDVKNIRVSQEGNHVTIQYDLTGEADNFDVDLFYTINEGQTWEGPLKEVTGDAGENIKPGINKKMI